jgi:hypothetical protein
VLVVSYQKKRINISNLPFATMLPFRSIAMKAISANRPSKKVSQEAAKVSVSASQVVSLEDQLAREGKMVPWDRRLYSDIEQVLIWTQTMRSSGIREGARQICIGLLTNPIRRRAILEGKETIEDFVRDCLEKDCPDLAFKIITENAQRFLFGNYTGIETIQDLLDKAGIDSEDFIDPEEIRCEANALK